MNGPGSRRGRFVLARLATRRVKGRTLTDLAANDTSAPDLVVLLTVSESSAGAGGRVRLESMHIRTLSRPPGDGGIDVADVAADPRWIARLLRTVERSLRPREATHHAGDRPFVETEQEPRNRDEAIETLRRRYAFLDRSREARLRGRDPIPPVTEAVVDQLVGEIEAFLKLQQDPGTDSDTA